jgi:endopolyphosphatase
MPRLPFCLRLPSKLRRRARRSRIMTLLVAVLIALILFAPLYVVYKPPSVLMSYLAQRWTDVIWRIWLPPSKKLVALTIDDAPSQHTPAILDVLRAHAAHATFFVIGGQVAGREDMLRDIVRAGHELGNHGMHDEVARALPDAELEAQIASVRDMIWAAYAAEGREPPGKADAKKNYYRPGSGFFSDRMRGVVRRMGHRIVLGSIYPHDAQIKWAWLNAKHVLSMLSPGGIIICHDRRSWTEPMLKKVLGDMRKRGYKAVTVTQLLAEATG